VLPWDPRETSLQISGVTCLLRGREEGLRVCTCGAADEQGREGTASGREMLQERQGDKMLE